MAFVKDVVRSLRIPILSQKYNLGRTHRELLSSRVVLSARIKVRQGAWDLLSAELEVVIKDVRRLSRKDGGL